MIGQYPAGTNYDIDQLREYGYCSTTYDDGSEEDSNEDDESGPDPNYECQTCGTEKYVDDHKRHAPSWCDSCEDIKTFVKLK